MEEDKLEATNRVLRDLERKLSLVLTVSLATSAQSHGSVVRDPQYGGVARESIQLSVINYIRNSGSDFDPDLVYSERQLRLITTFDRDYSTNTGKSASADDLSRSSRNSPFSADSTAVNESTVGETSMGLPTSTVGSTAEPYDGYYDDDFDSYCESDTETNPADPENVLDTEDNLLLPPLPPRLPPKEMDPNRLYGLFDFLGPDPLHCTLFREEPVYLVNDLDNYWWLIRKLTKEERKACNTTMDDVESDEEDGKIGFVPAECLETHGERLARLNCYKNEVLEKSSRGDSPSSSQGAFLFVNHSEGHLEVPEHNSYVAAQEEQDPPLIRRKGSILKKSGSYKQNNKLVTFENLTAFALDDDEVSEDAGDDSSDDVLSYRYYGLSHDDIQKDVATDSERHSEVLSDVYPADTPLYIPKTGKDPVIEDIMNMSLFSEPKLPPAGDDVSIGTYSPDTPPAQRVSGLRVGHEDASELRRSVILDKLSEVTQLLSKDAGMLEYKELSFGGSLKDSSADVKVLKIPEQHGGGDVEDDDESLLDYLESQHLAAEELTTPLTSSNSLNLSSLSPKLTPLEKKKRSKYEMCLPVLGQLEELTKKLAELEHLFEQG